METSTFSRIRSCHILTALGTYVIALTCMYWIGAGEDSRICATLGLGFGQISLLAIGSVVGSSPSRLWAFAVAALGCYLAMSLWVFIQGRHIDGVFYFSLALVCILYFIAMAAVMLTVRKLRGVTLVGLEDIRLSRDFSGQYGIRDIMIAMSVAALATALIKFFSLQEYARDLPGTLVGFGLISVSFLFISWPVMVACLSEQWRALTVLAVILLICVYLAEWLIFNSISRTSVDYWGFCFFLDASLVLTVAQHALIARWFGYRLTTSSQS